MERAIRIEATTLSPPNTSARPHGKTSPRMGAPPELGNLLTTGRRVAVAEASAGAETQFGP
jgi:hypothetical protein